MQYSKRSVLLLVSTVFALVCLMGDGVLSNQAAVTNARRSMNAQHGQTGIDPLLSSLVDSPAHNRLLTTHNLDDEITYTLRPDAQFGAGGRVTTDFGSRYDDVRAVALQPDGKMILVGKTESNDGIPCRAVGGGRFSTICTRCYTGTSSIPGANFALARYRSNGAPDINFGANGKVITDFGAEDEASAVAIQSNGKIIVAGQTYTVAYFGGPQQNVKFAVARYNPDGSLDTTFGGTGKVVTEFNTYGRATAVVVQSDGKIVVVGDTSTGQGRGFALARYNNDGSLDASYGVGGKIITGLDQYSSASALLIQPDNKIVAAGFASGSFSVNTGFALARYNSNGSLDTTFGGTGMVLTSFSTNSGSTPVWTGVQAITRQPDGKILAMGEASTTTANGFVLARYDSNGSLDTSFGNGDGFVISLTSPGNREISSIALEPSGKVITVGGNLLSRFNQDGQPDLTFGNSGSEPIGDDFVKAGTVLLLPDTKILVTGRVAVPITDVLFTDESCGNSEFMLAKYEIVDRSSPLPPPPDPGGGGGSGTGPKPQPPPGCNFSYPNWLNAALDSDISAIAFDTSGDDVKVSISADFPNPHLAKEGAIDFPSWIPFIGGKFGMLETYGRLSGEVSKNRGGGTLGIYGQTGFVAGGQNIFGSVSGSGDFSFTCNNGLALRRGFFNLSLRGTLKKESGLLAAIPPLEKLAKLPVIGKAVKWINDRATLIGEVTPSLHFGATFNDDGGNLGFREATGTLSLDLKGTLRINLPLDRIKARGWVAGSGSATVGVPTPPSFVRNLKVNFEAGVALDIDAFFREFHPEAKIAYGCKWTPDNGVKCGKEESSSAMLSPSVDDLAAGFRGSKANQNAFSLNWQNARLAHAPRRLRSVNTLSVIQPDYGRFGAYAAFQPSPAKVTQPSGRSVTQAPFAEQASTVISNIFPGASPTIIEAGSGKLSVWANQDPTLPVLQSTGIAWSFDDGSGWNSPSLIANDRQVELSPVAGVDAKGKAVAAWLRIKDPSFSASINKAEDLPRFYTRMEVVSAVFDPASRTWGKITQLTNDAAMDTNLRLSSDGMGRPLLTWLSNPNAEFISDPTSPSILKYSIWDGSKWSAPATIAGGLVGVHAHAVAMQGGKAFIILPRSTGPDGTGTGVLDLYTWNGSNWSAASTFAAGDVDNRLPSVVYDAAGEGHVVWVRGDDLVHATLSNPTPQVIRPGATSLAFYDTKLLTNSQGNLTLLFSQVTSEGPANIFALIYDVTSNTWSTDRRLHYDPALAHDFSGYYGKDGVLHLVYLATEMRSVSRTVVIEGETQIINNIPEEGRTDLRVLDHRLGIDLSVTGNDLSIIPHTSQVGSTDMARLDVHNSGDFAVSGFTVNIYRGDPNTGGVLLGIATFSEPLRAGDHRVVLLSFTMPVDIGDSLVAVVLTNNGVTEVTTANNRATLYFTTDTTPPILTVPFTITKEATSRAGAVVTFSASATDNRDPNPTVSCASSSGGTFPLGTTTVTCTATDASNNSASASFIVRVVDTTPPVITVPARITKNATSPAGAQVTYSASVSDIADQFPKLVCRPASGSTFQIGTTTVTCTATDASGNSVINSFQVVVRGAAEQLADLITTVESFNRHKKPGKKFDQELNKTLDALGRGDMRKACQELNKFVVSVQKESGKKLTVAEANQLLGAANQIRAVIDCR